MADGIAALYMSIPSCWLTMKNVLFYDRVQARNGVLFSQGEWNLEKVCSISHTLNHPFLRVQATCPLLFVVQAGPPEGELAEFIVYLKKYWPAMAIVCIPVDQQDYEIWRGLLKGAAITLMEKNAIHENIRLSFISSQVLTQN
jgi:hypothetical protein